MQRPFILIEGARQNNLKGVTAHVPIGAVTLVTGVAGAGKSSLAFDVLHAEGYRRYVETFSPYARQFLDRFDRPKVRRIEGVLPSVAVDRTAPVRTSRSTVSTMTSVADYTRALWARAATLHCQHCGQPVERSSPSTIFETMLGVAENRLALICFPCSVGRVEPAALRDLFQQAGFRRVLEDGKPIPLEDARLQPERGAVTVVLDRIAVTHAHRQRIVDSVESAFRFGAGHAEIWLDGQAAPLRFAAGLHCARCDVTYPDPMPALFSFNNPIGACETCKGFGRIIDIDPDLVVPDARLSVAEGCVRPFQTPAYSESQHDLLRFLRRRQISADVPWQQLDDSSKRLIWEGEAGGRTHWETRWYGIRGFFDWLASRVYRVHVRVFLSHYRRYLPCPACRQTRLKPGALLYRVADRTLPEVEAMPIADAEAFLHEWKPPATDTAAQLLCQEILGRLGFLVDVGLGYLTLSRQSRTLSGGEAQRVTLATALGSSLSSTLYVLDEPSVGLHPRDARQLAGVLHNLAANGNAVVVVEHDPAIIRAADHVIDLGPGPGRSGGEVVYEGPLRDMLAEPRSSTGAYLAGRRIVPVPAEHRRPDPRRCLRIVGARENNLKNLTVEIPLGLFVCVTGVSGSGKSTLVDQVLYRNVRRRFGQAESEPGACVAVEGLETLFGVVLVDQSPLARTSRMNGATYVGVLGLLRQAFADTEEARLRGLGPSAFSFNSAAGFCPNCRGAGYERIELQFLPDAYVRCPACDGRRFQPETLEVRCRGYNIAEMLDLSAAEVAQIFADDRHIAGALQPLIDIGLGYLSLSQPAPTLAGGEAQRLKLASYLARARKTQSVLFILDEPTTGLHPADVSMLVQALHRLVDDGHSVLVVEHNMDVARSADWLIDLGPEGGDNGGRLVGEGPADRIAQLDSPTGDALRGGPVVQLRRDITELPQRQEATAPAEPAGVIRILGAREHNLRGIGVDIPRERFVVITGVSGSGKSTLAFDVLFAEGQRRFLDCLPTYARQFIRPLARPDVDHVEGVPPTVALEQKLSRGGPMSTTGTLSEVYHYVRLLFAAVGTSYCPRCNIAAEVSSSAGIADRIAEHFRGDKVTLLAPLVRRRKGLHREAVVALARRGVTEVRIDGRIHKSSQPPTLDRYRVHDLEAITGRVTIARETSADLRSAVERALDLGGGTIIAAAHGKRDRLYSTRRACPECGSGLPPADPRLFTWSRKFGACPACGGLGSQPGSEGDEAPPCPACAGTRLRPEALAVRIRDRNIGEVAALTVQDARRWLGDLDTAVSPEVMEAIFPELEARLALLEELGLGYLTLDRRADRLSTGEAQRIRIVAQLASNLRGVCYVLDEPTVGLHPRNIQALSRALARLRDRGNTVVVVEHDESVIRASDHVIDLGPGPGPRGGRVILTGSPAAIARAKSSVTGVWLRGDGERPTWPRRPLDTGPRLTLVGARLHNLRDISVQFPLERLICITGVSGSGKSTLVRDILCRAMRALLSGSELPPILSDVQGWESVDYALEVDESPIGRTPRSVPATYIGVMDAIRELFASTTDARTQGWSPGRFSFNVAGGRCEHCEGQGRLRVTMALLPEVYILCDSCAGRRYNADTLAVRLKGKSIADVLTMTVDEARRFFGAFSLVRRPLDFLSQIGLGYLQLGQASPTLSGGEAQRVKLAAELARPRLGRSLYVLDEPTTGLHMADVAMLIRALQQLVDRGNTVVVIEHNLEVVAAADCVIDLGPEGGEQGGSVVAWGTPEQVAYEGESRTAPYLQDFLRGPNSHRIAS